MCKFNIDYMRNFRDIDRFLPGINPWASANPWESQGYTVDVCKNKPKKKTITSIWHENLLGFFCLQTLSVWRSEL